jgi:ABC-type antimicrobial peptide transport system permease subunit
LSGRTLEIFVVALMGIFAGFIFGLMTHSFWVALVTALLFWYAAYRLLKYLDPTAFSKSHD